MEDTEPFFGFLILFGERSVFAKKPCQCIAVYPDFIISIFLGLIKDQLHPEVEMYGIDVIGVFYCAIAGMPHIADHISGSYHTSFFKVQCIGEILTQMGIVIIAFSVKTADANAPASVLIPSEGFYIARFYCDYGRTNKNKK